MPTPPVRCEATGYEKALGGSWDQSSRRGHLELRMSALASGLNDFVP